MPQINDILTPALIFSVIVVIGYFVGKIKIFSISLGISGVLIISIFFGYILSIYSEFELDMEYKAALTHYSKLGSSLFASVIGISAGFCIGKSELRQNITYILLGALTSIAGILSIKIIGIIDKNIDFSALLGILCGALTSTPALSVACDINKTDSQLATVGYGAAYLVGVVGTVLIVQFFLRNNEAVADNKPKQANSNFSELCLISVCFVSILGQFIGDINIPLINFSLGTTGGIILCGIIFGVIVKQFGETREKIEFLLPFYRQFGLMMFFVGNGVTAGMQLKGNIEFKWFIYAAIVASVSIAFCDITGRFILKKSCTKRMYALAGSMTSTPALGVVIRKSNDKSDIVIYSLTYLGALISLILGVKILCL